MESFKSRTDLYSDITPSGSTIKRKLRDLRQSKTSKKYLKSAYPSPKNSRNGFFIDL